MITCFDGLFILTMAHLLPRVTLGVTTLLTLTSLAAGVRSELPPVSYLKVRSQNNIYMEMP